MIERECYKRRIYVRKRYKSIWEDIIFYIFCEWAEIRGRTANRKRMSGRQTTLGGRICICSFLVINMSVTPPAIKEQRIPWTCGYSQVMEAHEGEVSLSAEIKVITSTRQFQLRCPQLLPFFRLHKPALSRQLGSTLQYRFGPC